MSEALSPDELARYDRHLILPQVGLEGQKKLKASKVLLVGAGGLGSPLALYLASAGVGTIGLVDFDVVDASNLQRQVLHGTAAVGTPKTESARQRLEDLNPSITIKTYNEPLTAENALELLKPYDLIIDGTDNFSTRYLVNDACVMLGKPNVYGSIFRFEGQVSFFHAAAGGPCYRCLYPEPPPPGTVPSCAEGGVLGVLPGVVGTLQATEALKHLLGIGKSLMGRLLMFDALNLRFQEMKVKKSDDCPICGTTPTITKLVAYEDVCEPIHAEISPAELWAAYQAGERPRILDVREPHEWDIANLETLGARLIPLKQLEENLADLCKDEPVVVHCKSGGRSAKAQQILLSKGFTDVRNLTGGILRWSDEVDSDLPKY